MFLWRSVEFCRLVGQLSLGHVIFNDGGYWVGGEVACGTSQHVAGKERSDGIASDSQHA